MKKIVYAYADLETTYVVLPKKYKDYNEYYLKEKNPSFPKIYSWCVMCEEKLIDLELFNVEFDEQRAVYSYFGIEGKKFIEFLKLINKDTKIYFNNSKGFDAHFILPLLDKEGYTNVVPLFDKELKAVKNTNYIKNLKLYRDNRFNDLYKILTPYIQKNNLNDLQIKYLIEKKWTMLLENEYRLMVNGNTQIYQMTIATDQVYWSQGIKRNRVIQIRDNLLLFPTSIRKMGETIANYHINKLGWDKKKAEEEFFKQEINYNRVDLYKNYKEFENDGNEKQYLKQDVYILYSFHKLLEKYLPRKNWKLTAAATAYKMWLNAFNKSYLQKYVDKKIVVKVNVKNGGYKLKYKNTLYTPQKLAKLLLNELIPTKWLNRESDLFKTNHQEIYQWYFGGISMVSEEFRGKLVENITILDINSSYPNQMNLNVECPIGVGVRGDVKDFGFKLYEMYVKKEIKNTNGMPFLFNIFDKKRNYRRVLKPGMVVQLNTYEYDRFLRFYMSNSKSYDLKVCWSFKTTPIKNFFKEYVNEWYEVKKQAGIDTNPILKLIAKMFLNSLYGKFGTKSLRESKLWVSQEARWLSQEQSISSEFYLPIAIAITSLARMQLVDACGENFKKFVYCDTDSLFIKDFDNKDFNLHLDGEILGAWDIEKVGLTGIVRRSKQYLLLDKNNKKKVAFAGINFDKNYAEDEEALNYIEGFEKIIDTLSLYDFINGEDINAQNSPFRVVGEGIIITENVKRIKPIWEYEKLPEQKYYQQVHFKETIKKINKFYGI